MRPHLLAALAALLALPAKPFPFEKVGTLTLLHCDEKAWNECASFENLGAQLQVDWDAVRPGAAKKKAKSSRIFVDQYGGPWRVAAGAGGKASIVPDFPGYKVSGKGSEAQVEVLRNDEQWQAARRELGLDQP